MFIIIGLVAGVFDALIASETFSAIVDNAGDFLAEVPDLMVTMVAGVPYGIFTGAYLLRSKTYSNAKVRVIGWVAMSGIAYYAAVQTCIKLWFGTEYVRSSLSDGPAPFHYLVAGLVGALLLTIAFHLLFEKVSVRQYTLSLLLGAGIPYVLASIDSSFFEQHFVQVLYVAWQGAITAVLGMSFLRAKTKSE